MNTWIVIVNNCLDTHVGHKGRVFVPDFASFS